MCHFTQPTFFHKGFYKNYAQTEATFFFACAIYIYIYVWVCVFVCVQGWHP